MPTYTLIQPAVVVGVLGAADITFSAIPATYTDLVLKISARSSNASSDSSRVMFLSINNSSANLTARNIFAFGTTVLSDAPTSINVGALNGVTGTASTFNNAEIYIPNYAGSTNKSLSVDTVNESNTSTGNSLAFRAGLWSQTTAINSLKLTPDSGNFAQHSTAYLYGVSNA